MSKTRMTALFAGVGTLAVLVAAGAATRERWMPLLSIASPSAEGAHEHPHPSPFKTGSDDEHEHAHEADIELTPAGLKNAGFQPFVVRGSDFARSLTLPGVVVERPGRTQIHVAAPLTGVVTKVHALAGEAVEPGSPLFELRLTHEDLVSAQRDFLRTAESLDVVNREIDRLKSVGEGVIAGRRVLEQEYEQQKLSASLKAERQALLMHGVTEEQVDEILRTRTLLREVTVSAPARVASVETHEADHVFHVQRLPVTQGEHVAAGEALCVLADHCELFVEGLAFEDDAAALREAVRANRPVTARLLMTEDAQARPLELLYLADTVDRESRALGVYLRLPNEVALEKRGPHGQRFVEWRYKPGQRMQLRVPVEIWEDQLVVPASAVVEEAAEAYVYRQHEDHFERVPVHVVHRGGDSVVLADDGALAQRDVIAGQGAYQIHLALKNQMGGGVDPHAGHSH